MQQVRRYAAVEQVTEDEWIRRIRAGDAAAFERMFRAHYDALTGYAHAILWSTDAARDVVCDVFAAVWQAHAEWAPAGGVRAYLFRAVRNRCQNVARDTARRAALWERQHPDDLPLPSAQSIELAHELAHADELDWQWRAIHDAIATMPPLRREAARLRWVEQLEYVEIATLMNISVNAVQQHLSLALKSLRARFARESSR